MDEICIIAKLGNNILIVNKADIKHIGKEGAMEVMSVSVDLENRRIGPVVELEKHLKFNPWEEMSQEEQEVALKILNAKFSDNEIIEKIIMPLAIHRVDG